jgi:hypothetical protein
MYFAQLKLFQFFPALVSLGQFILKFFEPVRGLRDFGAVLLVKRRQGHGGGQCVLFRLQGLDAFWEFGQFLFLLFERALFLVT